MCGRYYIDIDQTEMRSIIDHVNRRIAGDSTADMRAGDIRPTDIAPVYVAKDKAVPMRWGFEGPSAGKVVINARSETAAEKPMFRDALAMRRCLIPASSYFEWERTSVFRTKWAIRAKERLLFMAGLYQLEQSMPRFVILTRAAAPGIAFIHNRMPVILDHQARLAYLQGMDANAVFSLAAQDMIPKPAPDRRGLAAEQMRFWPEG